ncbi:hypothetical protein [Streptomyces sp. NPDC050263]|uniref:hypothetical protein n=1 Tax=Streptomyces sp. NPDC050263 TaxID=3155037 RepID=UPI00342685DC
MPGQGKRRRGRQRGGAPQAVGRWEALFETQDEPEFRTELRRLRAEHPEIDETAIRVDTFCGRSTHPTTYRLSVFVPAAES